MQQDAQKNEEICTMYVNTCFAHRFIMYPVICKYANYHVVLCAANTQSCTSYKRYMNFRKYMQIHEM